MSAPRRHFVIADTQIRPGVPTDFIDWVGQALVDYKPDVIVHLGDHWDFQSLNGHEKPGSAPMEGLRYQDDVEAGNIAFARLCAPMEAEIERLRRNHERRWAPEKHFICGNHESRADRVAQADPKWLGHVGTASCQVRDWTWHPFLQRVEIDGLLYSHFFQQTHSDRPISGEVPHRLTKIGCSFVQGHEQGKRTGSKIMASGKTLYGLVIGSCYLHIEPYRGAQGQRHWRGCALLNEVKDGEYDICELSLGYLCRKYTKTDLPTYMAKNYPAGSWEHLA